MQIDWVTGTIFSLSPRKKIEDDDRNYAHWSIKAKYSLVLLLHLFFQSRVMPCPSTGPKMFRSGPNFLSQSKNVIVFSATSKTKFIEWKSSFGLAQNVYQFLVQSKKFGPARNILGPVEGQGISGKSIACVILFDLPSQCACRCVPALARQQLWNGHVGWNSSMTTTPINPIFIFMNSWKIDQKKKHNSQNWVQINLYN